MKPSKVRIKDKVSEVLFSSEFKTCLFSNMGVVLEWFQFYLYIALNGFWGAILFKGSSQSYSQECVLIILCISYFGRLVGGSIMASIADRYGRKFMFLKSSILMTSSSFLISILPINHIPQKLSITFFCLLQFFQGVSVGGETPGTQTLVFETVSKKKKALSLSLLNFSGAIGTTTALLVVSLTLKVAGSKNMIDFAWRIPYLIASLLSLLVVFFRRFIKESEAFKSIGVESTRPVFSHMLKFYYGDVILAILLVIVSDVLYKFMMTGNIYFIQKYHFAEDQLLYIATKCFLFSAFLNIFFGFFIDRYYYIKRYLVLSFLILVLVNPITFYRLYLHTNFIYFQLFFSVWVSYYLFSIIIPLWVAEKVPATVRTSVLTIIYNLTIFLVSIFVTLLTIFINHSSNPTIMPLIILSLSPITFFGLLGVLRDIGRRKVEYTL